MLHKNITPPYNHGIFGWIVADPTALAALVLAPDDVGKVAWQLAPATFFVLVDDSPATWTPLLTSVGTVPASGVSVTDAGNFFAATQVEAALQEIGAWYNILCVPVALSDELTALTTGGGKVTIRSPFKAELIDVKAMVNTAPTGSILIVDINKNGTTMMAVTKLSIDAGEKTSRTAAAAPVLSTTTLAEDDEISFDIDQIGSTIAGAGLKAYLYLKRVP